eukprot:4445626-Pyramimonas_sp.AAC.1
MPPRAPNRDPCWTNRRHDRWRIHTCTSSSRPSDSHGVISGRSVPCLQERAGEGGAGCKAREQRREDEPEERMGET